MIVDQDGPTLAGLPIDARKKRHSRWVPANTSFGTQPVMHIVTYSSAHPPTRATNGAILSTTRCHTPSHLLQQRKLSTCSPITLDLACTEQCPIAANVEDLDVGMMPRKVFSEQRVPVAARRVLLAAQHSRRALGSVSQ